MITTEHMFSWLIESLLILNSITLLVQTAVLMAKPMAYQVMTCIVVCKLFLDITKTQLEFQSKYMKYIVYI